MRLSDFKFKLPEELIAQYPAPYRCNELFKLWYLPDIRKFIK